MYKESIYGAELGWRFTILYQSYYVPGPGISLLYLKDISDLYYFPKLLTLEFKYRELKYLPYLFIFYNGSELLYWYIILGLDFEFNDDLKLEILIMKIYLLLNSYGLMKYIDQSRLLRVEGHMFQGLVQIVLILKINQVILILV